MDDLLVKLKEKYPTLTLSRFHLSRIVRDNNITLKITRIRHEPTKRFGKEIDINAKIKDFYKEVKKYNIIFYILYFIFYILYYIFILILVVNIPYLVF